jgi:hypothetical protein
MYEMTLSGQAVNPTNCARGDHRLAPLRVLAFGLDALPAALTAAGESR